MPTYIASGGHYFGQTRYRFLILPRFDFDLHSIIKSRRMDTKNILIIADQLVDILEHLHDNGYAHSDIKAENIMVTNCTYDKNKYAKTGATETTKESSKLTSASPTAENSKRKAKIDDSKGKRSIYRSGSSSKESSVKDSDSDEEYEVNDDDFEEDEDDEEDEEEKVDAKVEPEVVNVKQKVVQQNESDVTDSDSDFDRRNDKDFTPRTGNQHIEYGGSNPVRSCRGGNKTQMYDDMLTSHYLRRPTKPVNYCEEDYDEEKPAKHTDDDDDDDDWSRKNRYIKKLYASKAVYEPKENRLKMNSRFNYEDKVDSVAPKKSNSNMITEDRVYLIDFGLALKFVDSNGTHRPFIMDQRRAHDGTLEFTSRDAHMGAHSRRSDLECLGFNLIFWIEGFLPWKSDKLMNQPEQIHRMKEIFMTDIRELYKKVYSVPIPTFIYEYMIHVGNLSYNERPNYKLCKEIFLKEFLRLGYKKNQFVLSIDALKQIPTRSREDEDTETLIIEHKLAECAKMLKFGMILPFCETPVTQNQISPKNLRSKSVKNPIKKSTNFSWTEILSTDPDQIARQRAEKEFEWECDQTPPHRYSGKPTYAILEVENSKNKNKVDYKEPDTHSTDSYIKGYTKPMMDVWRKRQLTLMQQFQLNNNNHDEESNGKSSSNNSSVTSANGRINKKKRNGYSEKHHRRRSNGNGNLANTFKDLLAKPTSNRTQKRKSGLRRVVTPTKKIMNYRNNMIKVRRRRKHDQEYYPTDEYSNSGNGSDGSRSLASDRSDISSTGNSITDVNRNTRKYNSSGGSSSPASEDDSRETNGFSPMQTRHARVRKTTTLKSMAISDEDSRDTTDYSPVKSRYKSKTKDGKNKRKRQEKKPKRAAKGKVIIFTCEIVHQ